MRHAVKIAIIGADDLVGQAILEQLDAYVPAAQVFVLAEDASDEVVDAAGLSHAVEDIASFDFSLVDVAIFCAGNEVAQRYVPIAAQSCWVIDESSALRGQPETQLLVPHINAPTQAIEGCPRILTAPNAVAWMLATVLASLRELSPIASVSVVSLHSASALGRAAVDELARQTTSLFNQQDVPHTRFPQRLSFNVLPHIGSLRDDGLSLEEQKIQQEVQTILSQPDLPISATAIRVPVFFAHSAVLQVQTVQPVDVQKWLARLAVHPMIAVIDDANVLEDATPSGVLGGDKIALARVQTLPNQQVKMWLCVDNIKVAVAQNCLAILAWWLEQQQVKVLH